MTGRPIKFSDDVADHICAEIACGRSLKRICAEDEGMPTVSGFYHMMRTRPELKDRYYAACMERVGFYVEEMVDIADDCDDPQKARVQIDTRKWVSARLDPARYGDKLGIVGGDGKGPVRHQVTFDLAKMTDEQLAAYHTLASAAEGSPEGD